MKKKNILYICTTAIMMASCYDGVEDNLAGGNTMEQAVDSVSNISTAAGLLITAQEQLIDKREHKYQYQFNLHIDNYCGYMCLPHNFSGRINSTFEINDNFASGPKANMSWVAQATVPVMTSAKRLNAEPLGAIANILFSYAAHQFVNVHGPFPYNANKRLQESHPLVYDAEELIYDSIFTDLEKDIAILKKYENNLSEEMQTTISGMDKIAGGNLSKWIKFANSLRLRMALNIVKIQPEKARQIAEDAVRNGVLEESDGDVGMDLYTLYNKERHPLWKISSSWVDTRLNANLHNILLRTGHPMLESFFEKNSADIIDRSGKISLQANQGFASMRNGTLTTDQSSSPAYISFSKLSQNFSMQKLMIFKVSEVLFLRAEGALYGWNMNGTPQALYEAGIRASFNEFGFTSDACQTYMQSEKAGNENYIDYYNVFQNVDGVLTIPNKWLASGSNEEHLEQIITQKWIALFPMSLVAWTDMRRTGYPKQIAPVTNSEADGDGSIDPKYGIRRIPFSRDGDLEVADDIESTGLDALGGPDLQGTRLWWDVNKSNF